MIETAAGRVHVTFVVSFETRMERLGPADLEHVLQFLGELASVESEEPFTRELLLGLKRLVPCDWLGFCELDRVHELDIGLVDDPPYDGDPPPCSYWEIRHEHPVCHYHEVSGDFGALKLSDFMSQRQLHSSRIYRDWFGPTGVEYLMTVGLDAPLWHTKVFLFERCGGRDFTDRDRAVLDALRPHLARRYAESQARRRAREALALLEGIELAVVLVEDGDRIAFATDEAHRLLARYFGEDGARLPGPVSAWMHSAGASGEPPLEVRGGATLEIRVAGDALFLEERPRSPRLTLREQEILDQVAAGRTNAEIAATLCVAPGTVRRHLENIFGKLGVHNRTAAVATLRRQPAAP
jgi:DNA-binding CsgD family transcriptional regulator